MQRKIFDVSKYFNSSFGPFSQVFGSVLGFFFSLQHLGLWHILNCQTFLPIFNHFPVFLPLHGR